MHVKPIIVTQLNITHAQLRTSTNPYTGATWSCSTLEMEMPLWYIVNVHETWKEHNQEQV